MNVDYKVTATELRYRSEPNLQANILGKLVYNSTITVTDIKKDSSGNTWGKHSKGWTCITTSSGKTYLTKISVTSQPSTTPTKSNDDSKKKVKTPVTPTVTKKSTAYQVTAGSSFKLQSARSILGLPAQFTKFADPKVGGSAFGRAYSNDILLDMPLCLITPGRPKFLAGEANTKEAKDNWLNILLNGGNTSGGTSLNKILDDLLNGKVARYYTFQSAYAELMPYVNSMNNVMAQYLGIGDKKGTSKIKKYSTLDWQTIHKMEITNGGLLDFIGNAGAIPFYYDKGGTGMSESASNSTDKSSLDGVLQTASSSVKEAAFITNSFAGKDFDPFNTKEGAASKLANLSTDLVNSSSMVEQIITNLKSGFTTVASGGNLLLPEIWKDSSFSRSYSLDFHFATPYGDPESFLLNIGVPLNYLLCLTLPTQFGANGYSAPFLIQAFAQGVFNCSMGIIESISISKFGSGDAISRSGLPLEVKVSVTFKDLYNALSITNYTKNIEMFANNIELIDYIACMSGVNLNTPDIERKIMLFVNSKMDSITNLPGNVKLKIQDYIRNALLGVIKY